ALRFRVDDADEEVCFDDGVQGRACFRPAADTGDFVVRRKDGVAAYQLAVVVDDAAMGITDVVRGGDLLGSTARQILLFRALGLAVPRYAHAALMLGADGERLSKRHGAVSLAELRGEGVAPEKVVGWLASTCGLAEPGEQIRAADLVPRFTTALIPAAPTVVTGASLAALRTP
ncbi:MAG TPA: glutamate--tRNA ligase family protein, partial [Longimicrobium sp.]|nr:glutamate--tRNA ligase family protein [Longimicrobium sp.]